MTTLTLENIYIEYGDTTIVHDINLAVKDGDIGCLLGPSGCGKTTLLRAIAGFENIKSGTIRLGDQVISSTTTHLPPEQRNIGMVFQDYALFPHLSVGDNITFGIRQQSNANKQQRIQELLKLVNLSGYENRYPHELSGGQQQRIALARALAPRPKLLLMDEPLGSQDLELREILAREVRDILKREGTTAILVTHDQHEAFAMADEIGVLGNGRLQQWDKGYQLYHEPDNRFVAEFIGQGSLLPGTVLNPKRLATPLGDIDARIPGSCQQGCLLDVLIRPDDIQLSESGEHTAQITSRAFRGAQYMYTLGLNDKHHILALAPSHQVHDVGEIINFTLDMQHLVTLHHTEPR
uniref:Ferric iron ABC transporter, ATP-binding protein n=1 Tax=uncultured Thiotrichaceae bacterium TaxID=298394 RepID=A0A6S6T5S5_9GAMM|nr:MAG: Ferric iron ABC transporter, ATP-binding protein [uncultured Thiotrichaceae bacterium]